jgi:hypothetical protein
MKLADPVRIIHSNIKPDKDDPNYHCKACEKTLKTRGGYRNHLKVVHQMEFTPRFSIPNPHVSLDEFEPTFTASL